MSGSGISKVEIAVDMQEALETGQFKPYYQPQYNHNTGMLIGAEALARWIHPKHGLISPAEFIPVFEKTGFISRFDLYIFEQVCAFIRRMLDEGVTVVPISTNVTRYDLYTKGFIKALEGIRKKYDVPANLIRLEITESAALGTVEKMNECIRAMHEYGFKVEMDDFGSGYSSLNMLKDIDVDIIKLDMKFLSDGNSTGGRGGTILSSVVRMMNWLEIPLIAEGVETSEQADFLRSIGCNFIQGYYYSRPIPEAEFTEKLKSGRTVNEAEKRNFIVTLDAENFWNPESLDTLIFSNYVGGAAIFSYSKGKLEILRVNKKYLQEMGMNTDECSMIKNDPWEPFDEENKQLYIEMLEKAIRTEEEQECETMRSILSSCCGDEKMYIRSNVRMIGKSGDEYLFYSTIRNITKEKLQQLELSGMENRFNRVIEQVNIYYWEYDITTKEMHPCYRCMRDFGFPAVVKNYPEPAIAAKIIPEDYAETYREWHRKMENGVKEFEAVIPLTVGRVPFRVKYTVSCDEFGRPVKAFGSATMI